MRRPDITAILDDMGLAAGRRFDIVHMHDHWEVRDQSTVTRHQVRQVVRAEVEGRMSWPVFYQDPAQQAGPHVVAGFGLELGAVHHEPSLGLVVAELVVPYPVAYGELVALDFGVDWAGAVLPDVMRHLGATARSYLMTARFTGRQPTEVGYTVEPAELSAPVVEASLPVRGEVASHMLLNAAAGTHAYDWSL